jgi:hypothetical protein
LILICIYAWARRRTNFIGALRARARARSPAISESLSVTANAPCAQCAFIASPGRNLFDSRTLHLSSEPARSPIAKTRRDASLAVCLIFGYFKYNGEYPWSSSKE